MADATRTSARIEIFVELSNLASQSESTQASRLIRLVDGFVGFASNLGIDLVSEVTPGLCDAFVRSPSRGILPSTRLMQQRRTALRLAFRLARQAGVMQGDPTADIELDPRRPSRVRPLTDQEIAGCRSAALWSLEDTRRCAAFALAEATARSSEIACVRVSDVALTDNRVWLHGGKVTQPRWGYFTPWGRAQLARRLDALEHEPDHPLVYTGRTPAGAGQVSSCAAVTDVLRRAGLATEPDVRAGSIAAWAGRRILDQTGRIDQVAQRLGMASLDRVADLIHWDWRTEDPP